MAQHELAELVTAAQPLERIRVVGAVEHLVDRDREALAAAGDALRRFGSRVSLHHARSDEVGEVLAREGISHATAVLADLAKAQGRLARERERADRLMAAFTTAGLVISAGSVDRIPA